jgi:hypothetical protein
MNERRPLTSVLSFLAFDLDLDARLLGPERVAEGEDVDPAILPRRRDPRDAVAHPAKKPGDEVLEVVRAHGCEVTSDLCERRLLRLLDGERVWLLLRRFGLGCGLQLLRLLLHPRCVVLLRLLHERLRVGVLLRCREALLSRGPDALVLGHPARLDGLHCLEANELREARRAVAERPLLVVRWLEPSCRLREGVLRLDAVGCSARTANTAFRNSARRCLVS